MPRPFLMTSCCVLAFALGPVAHAEDAANASDSSAIAAAGPTQLKEIIVTATKRAESLQKVPMSIQAISGERLTQNNVSQIQDLYTQVPGMSLQISPTTPAVSLRGFGTAPNNPAYAQTVAIYQDGVFAGRARDFQSPFFDLARVEVLKGPQGSLLGKNTSAGALSFISALPTDTLSAQLSTTYLIDRQGVDASGFVSGPLTPTLDARLAFHVEDTTDGFVHNVATGRGDPRTDLGSVRLSFRWRPTASFENITRFEYDSLNDYGTVAANFPGTVPLTSVVSYTRNFAGAFGQEDGLKLRPYQFSNQANLDIGGVTVQSMTGLQGYSALSITGASSANPETFAVLQGETWSQVSQEIRALSPSTGRFQWVAGLYGDHSVYHTNFGLRYNLFGGLFNGDASLLYRQHEDTFSAYATGTYNVTDALKAIAGLRYTFISKDGDFRIDQLFGLPFGWDPRTRIAQSMAEAHLDPQFTLQYQVTPAVMVYASYSQGSKGGAFQATNQTVTAAGFGLKPERADAYEVGLKSRVGGWLTFDIDVFQLKVTNLQTGQYVGTPPALVNVNVGSARSRGVEWQLTLRPIDDLTISYVGSYMHAIYLDYPGAPCTYAQLATGCVNGSVNAAGEYLPGQPKSSGSVTIDYHHPVTDRFNVFLSTEVDYRSRTNIDAGVGNPLFGYQDPYAKLNGRVGFQTADGHWEFALVARNLFDTLTVNSTFAWGPPFVAKQTVVTRVDEARSLGLQVQWRY